MKKMAIESGEQGSALVYILIAIALLAALTISFMEPSSQQTQSQNSFNLTSELAAQSEFIRTAVQECVVIHSGGDAGALSAVPVAQFNQPFPINPGASYYDNNTVDPDNISDNRVEHLRCAGNPGDNPDHQLIFAGKSGKFLPPPLPLFEPWEWYNGPDGVFFWTRTHATDAYINTALEKLNEQFGPCEADIVRTSGTSINMDNAGDAVCPYDGTDGDSYCFRVWMVTDTETVIDAEESVFSAAEAAACNP